VKDEGPGNRSSEGQLFVPFVTTKHAGRGSGSPSASEWWRSGRRIEVWSRSRGAGRRSGRTAAWGTRWRALAVRRPPEAAVTRAARRAREGGARSR
jgi:hypothetical protein